MAFEKVKKLQSEMNVCIRCAYCFEECPIVKVSGWDSDGARGKIILTYGLIQGDLKPSQFIADKIFQCTTCGDCLQRCPSKVKTLDIIRQTRGELAELGFMPENMKLGIENIKENKNPFGEKSEKKIDFIPEEVLAKKGKGADVLLYLGCVISLQNMKMTSSIFSIFEKSGIDYTFLGDKEPCCGVLSYLGGLGSKQFGQQLLSEINKLKPRPKTIVTPCPGCFRSLSENYPEEGVELKAEVKHIIEYLNTVFEKGDLIVGKKLDGKVLYHDPCDLGRHSDIYEPPRELLSRFTEVHEFTFNRDKAHCCGGGGGLQSVSYETAAEIAKRRVREAIDLDADIIVTACPACNATLSTAAVDIKKETGKKVKVKDLMEIVASHSKSKKEK